MLVVPITCSERYRNPSRSCRIPPGEPRTTSPVAVDLPRTPSLPRPPGGAVLIRPVRLQGPAGQAGLAVTDRHQVGPTAGLTRELVLRRQGPAPRAALAITDRHEVGPTAALMRDLVQGHRPRGPVARPGSGHKRPLP